MKHKIYILDIWTHIFLNSANPPESKTKLECLCLTVKYNNYYFGLCQTNYIWKASSSHSITKQ